MPENAIASDDEGSGASVLLLRRRPFFWREMRSAARNEKKCIEQGKNLRGRFTFFFQVRFQGASAAVAFANKRKLRLRLRFMEKVIGFRRGKCSTVLVDEMQIINRL